jgi:hypothetical protein
VCVCVCMCVVNLGIRHVIHMCHSHPFSTWLYNFFHISSQKNDIGIKKAFNTKYVFLFMKFSLIICKSEKKCVRYGDKCT